jgi:ClpP class serine protease
MVTQWLMMDTALNELAARARELAAPSAEDRRDFEARTGGTGNSRVDRLLTVAGGTAEIAVTGILTKEPDFWAYYFGGGNTSYNDMIAAMAAAENDPTVEHVDFAVDSPGGAIDGLFDSIAALQAMKKPTRVIVRGMAASAAYAFAANADEFVAHNAADMLGSVGIVANFRVDDSVVAVTSTEAPNKRPDVTTVEGQAVVREELDAIHELFAQAIADGRNTTVETVNANFGSGGVLLAGEALKRGMIDAIGVTAAEPTASMGGTTEGSASMTLEELKAQHPAVFAAAKAEGATEERERVEAHLTLGKASGDMDTAIEAVESGADLTAKYQAKYMAAKMNNTELTARAGDEATVAAAANNVAPAAPAASGAQAREDAEMEALINGEFM